ncbi:MAG: 2OG-Fe(II) oxygenase family protein [Halioglobus sp.]
MRLAAQPDPYGSILAKTGRVHVPLLLEDDSAKMLYEKLAQQAQWNLVFTRDGEHVDIGADSVKQWTQEQIHQFETIVHTPAQSGFQYLYKNIPVYDIYHRKLLPGHFLNDLFEFLNSEAFLNFGRRLTGRDDIGFCDAQATCYEAGHFLTCHDDATQGKNRVAAYVLNLTPQWNPDWGGTLQFYDDDNNIVAGFGPSFNALNVFRIPCRHAVSFVAPFATGSRFSITGWFRTGEDPGAD